MGFFLGQDRHQHIAAVDLGLAAALNMGNSPLQHPVAGDGLGRFGRPASSKCGDFPDEKLLQTFFQNLGRAAALIDDVVG